MSQHKNALSSMLRLSKIGEGSYGIVYSGQFRDDESNKFYAVKRNFKELSTNWIGNIHEADILVRLKGHPCIVELHKISMGDPFDASNPMTPKITTEDKKTMKEDKMHFILEYLTDSGDTYLRSIQFSYVNSRLILCQVLLALDYMHSKKILHRDLKPANILIHYENSVPYAKVCDFGMSSNTINIVPKTPGVVTCWYRAPEVCFGHYDYGEKADVWSFGCLLYEFFAKSPWLCGTEDDDLKIVNKIVAKLEDPPEQEDIDYLNSKARKKLKINLNDTMTKRLKFESQMRFNSADKIEFERECGPYDRYIELLKQCLQLNPNKRPTVKELLDNKFFKVYESYIYAVQNRPCQSTNETLQYLISDTQERRWAMNVIVQIFNEKENTVWYKDLIIFHSMDLFERYISWRQTTQTTKFVSYNEENSEHGFFHTVKESELYMWSCLYIMHKYYCTLEHPKRWTDFAPEEFHNKEFKDSAKHFELTMIKHVCNYRVFRNTVFEIMDCENKTCTPADIYKLLIGYIQMTSYIGSVEGLYNNIMSE
jgi:serine/threonine protein kinase